MRHKLRVARPSREVARRLGLNRNHHVRLWCECMDDPVAPPGTYAGQHAAVVNPRSAEQAAEDPRRLGGYDHFAVVDVREPGSILAAYREHVRGSS